MFHFWPPFLSFLLCCTMIIFIYFFLVCFSTRLHLRLMAWCHPTWVKRCCWTGRSGGSCRSASISSKSGIRSNEIWTTRPVSRSSGSPETSKISASSYRVRTSQGAITQNSRKWQTHKRESQKPESSAHWLDSLESWFKRLVISINTGYFNVWMCGCCRSQAGVRTVNDEEVWKTGKYGRHDDDWREPKAGRTQAGKATKRSWTQQGNQTISSMYCCITCVFMYTFELSAFLF